MAAGFSESWVWILVCEMGELMSMRTLSNQVTRYKGRGWLIWPNWFWLPVTNVEVEEFDGEA